MKYHLHIGLPKTGTTTLQNHVFPHLDQHGIAHNPTPLLQFLMGAINLQDTGLLDEAHKRQLIELFRKADRDNPDEQEISISLEALSWGLGATPYIERFELLKALVPNSSLYVTLRDPAALARSTWIQALQSGSRVEAPAYFGWHNGRFEPFDPHTLRRRGLARFPTLELMNFARLRSAAHKVFGERDTHLHYLEDFPSLRALGIELLCAICPTFDTDRLPKVLPRENASLSVEGVRLIQMRTELLETFGVQQVAYPAWHYVRHEAERFIAFLDGHAVLGNEFDYVQDNNFVFEDRGAQRILQNLPPFLRDIETFRRFVQQEVPSMCTAAGRAMTRWELPEEMRAGFDALKEPKRRGQLGETQDTINTALPQSPSM